MLQRLPVSGGDEGHTVAVVVGVLEVVDAGEFVDDAGEGGVLGDVGDALAVEPDLAAVVEALEVAFAGHCAVGGADVEDQRGLLVGGQADVTMSQRL